MEKEVIRKYLVIAIIVIIAIGILFLVNTKFTGNMTGRAIYGIAGAPTISSVDISPSSPTPSDDLTGSVSASDGEGDNITYWYSWYKDSSLNATTLIDSGLVSYWSLDNDVLDYYGSNDGVTSGGVTYGSSGKLGDALDFDGVDGEIEVAYDDSFNFSKSGEFTVSLWIKPDALDAEGNAEVISHYYSTTDDRIWSLQVRQNYSRFVACGNGNLSSCAYSTGTTQINPGNWYHLVGKWNGTNIDVYVNGVEEDSGADPLSELHSSSSVDIGIAKDAAISGDNSFNGILDEILIFNRTLSSSEIQQLYYGGVYGNIVSSSYTGEGDEWELKARVGDSGAWSDETNSGSVTVSADSNNPDISFSSSTTSEGEHNQDWINVGADLSDESQIYSFIDFNNSLNAFYKLNDTGATLKDYSSNGYDGTISGASSSTGKFGDSLYFDGADTADCAGAGNFERTDNFSVSVWVKSEPLAKGIIQRYDGTKGWSLFTTAAGALVLDIRHDATYYVRRRSVNTVTDSTWKHIVFTYDGSSTLAGTHVYVDGELDDSSSSNVDTLNDSISTGTNCKIGILHNYGNYRWIGDIDEVLIFDYVLSSNEISALYNASSYSHNFTNLGEGGYDFYAYTQDTYGNENQTGTRTITLVDNLAPTITLAEPQNTLYTNNESLALNFTVSDDNDAIENLTCWYNLDSGSNISISNCANTTFSTSDETTHTLNIFANDSEGLEGSDSVIFDVDSIGVSVSITQPTGTKTSRTSIPLQFTTTGNNLTCWYNVKTSIGGDVIDNTTLSNCQNTTFSVATDGDYVLNLFANNTFGSSDSDSSSFSVDTSTSPPSGGGGGGGSRTTIVQNLTAEVTVSELSDLIVNPGDVKKITWKVKNTGTSFLNDCKLEGIGQYSSWFSMEGVKDLAAGEEHEFIITINIPEEIGIGKYNLGVLLNCQETNKGAEFIAEVLEQKIDLQIIEVVKEEEIIKMIYSLEELSGIDQEVNLQFLLFTQNEEKILEIIDTRSIGANSVEEYSINLPIDSSLKGEFKLLVNINSDTYSGVIQEDLILGGTSGISGFTIFGESKGVDNIIALVLIVGFLIFAIFVIRRIVRSRKKQQ